MTTTPLPPLPTEALRQLREVIPFRLRLAFKSGEIEEGDLRVIRDSAEKAAFEIELCHKEHTQARADLEAENAKLREALNDIAEYTGEGPLSTPWRDIVKACGEKARAALENRA